MCHRPNNVWKTFHSAAHSSKPGGASHWLMLRVFVFAPPLSPRPVFPEMLQRTRPLFFKMSRLTALFRGSNSGAYSFSQWSRRSLKTWQWHAALLVFSSVVGFFSQTTAKQQRAAVDSLGGAYDYSSYQSCI